MREAHQIRDHALRRGEPAAFSSRSAAARHLLACRPHPQTAEEKRSFLSEFSLCLSRACLGKIIILIYKWRKKPGQHYEQLVFELESGPGGVCVALYLIAGKFYHNNKVRKRAF